MNAIYALLLLLGLLCFLGDAFGAKVRTINLTALGLAFFILVPLIQTVRIL